MVTVDKEEGPKSEMMLKTGVVGVEGEIVGAMFVGLVEVVRLQVWWAGPVGRVNAVGVAKVRVGGMRILS